MAPDTSPDTRRLVVFVREHAWHRRWTAL